MTSVWQESLRLAFDAALDSLAAAVRECPEGLWDTAMWDVPADLFGPAPPGPDGIPVTEEAVRRALVQRRSTPWSVAWHALEVLDYDLTAESAAWSPPLPFAGHPHWMLTAMPAPWTRADLIGYVDHCRRRVSDTFAGLTDERAARVLPDAHRYAGQPYASILTSLPSHTVEHAAQIRQFVNDRERRSPA